MKVKSLLVTCIILGVCAAACRKNTASNPQDEMLQLNQLQIIASHNSYHKKDTILILNLLDTIRAALASSGLDPREIDYGHLPFDEQMNNYPVRGLELDIYNDPVGGVFYTRKINEFVHLNDTSFAPELLLPGFKMLHIKDADYNSTYNTFKLGLQAIKKWSDAHPNHLPLFINIETKEDAPSQNATLASIGFKPAVPFDHTSPDALDNEIKSVFGPNLDQVLTPDRIRNGLPNLIDVVQQHKWPKLGQCRGKVVFIMEGNCVPYYLARFPHLKDTTRHGGCAVFIYAAKGSPEAAFLEYNDAKSSQSAITQSVREGYIIRTRSDAGTIEARAGDYSSMNAAFASGANIISTDYYKADPRGSIPGSGWTTFQVKFPNGELARKNPVSADTVKVDAALKE